MGTTTNKPQRIGWDHPLCQRGIVPGYLIQEQMGYTDSYWARVYPKWSFCKTINGQQWIDLDAFKAFLSSSESSTAIEHGDQRDPGRIDWDHPVVKFGIVPGYLVREMMGWTECTWKKKYRTWPFAKTMNGEAWVSLPALESYLASAE